MGADPFFLTRRDCIVALAARNAIPTIYEQREFDYSGRPYELRDRFNGSGQVGVYTGRVLKGGKLAVLPVLQSAKFEFVINLKTAKTLDLAVPEGWFSLRTRRSIRPSTFWLDDASDRAQNVCFWHLADIATAARG